MESVIEAAEQRLADEYQFTDAQIERLSVYRAAIAAGFYTDELRPGEVIA